MADMLATLARLRKLQADQAKRDLAEAVARERAARRALLAAQAVVAQEARVAAEHVPGAFAAWLPMAATTIQRCQLAVQQAAASRETMRENLAGQRAALKATQTRLETRDRLIEREADRKAEKALSDMPRPARHTI